MKHRDLSRKKPAPPNKKLICFSGLFSEGAETKKVVQKHSRLCESTPRLCESARDRLLGRVDPGPFLSCWTGSFCGWALIRLMPLLITPLAESFTLA